MKKALITGITGQDGSYLSELLLAKGYEVHGLKRRASSFNTQRLEHLYQDYHLKNAQFFLHYSDLTDGSNLVRLINDINPVEIYHLAAQSHVRISFDMPEYTASTVALGTLKLLEAMRICGLEKKCRFYQASTSELYGKVQEVPQNEGTAFYPRSPYAVAKLYAYWIVVNYREAYGMHASNGILFNHESPQRGETFVTRKITRAAARIAAGLEKQLFLGNLDAQRDWGYAGDYVEAMWLMLQQQQPQDYVIASGKTHRVRDFCSMAFERVGLPLTWVGKGLDERGIDAQGRTIIQIDPIYFRPTEVDSLLGDPALAKQQLGWSSQTSLSELVAMMVAADVKQAQRECYLLKGEFNTLPSSSCGG